MRSRRPAHSSVHDVFGRVVRESRARRELSQEELGFQAKLHRNYVGAIERGEINPTLRRQALEDELERVGPPKDPQLDQAAALLADFGRFWDIEPSHAERRKLLASLFERIWEQSGTITAVKPRAPFARYFTAAEPLRQHYDRGGAESGSDGTRTLGWDLGSRFGV